MTNDPNQEREQQEDLNIPKKTQAEPSKEDLEASKVAAQAEQGMGFERIHQTPGQPFEWSKAVNVPKGLTIKGFEEKAAESLIVSFRFEVINQKTACGKQDV